MLPHSWRALVGKEDTTLKRVNVHRFVRDAQLDVKLSGRGRPIATVLDDLCEALGVAPAELVRRMAAEEPMHDESGSAKRVLSLDDVDSLASASEAAGPSSKKRTKVFVDCGIVYRGHRCTTQLTGSKVRLPPRVRAQWPGSESPGSSWPWCRPSLPDLRLAGVRHGALLSLGCTNPTDENQSARLC